MVKIKTVVLILKILANFIVHRNFNNGDVIQILSLFDARGDVIKVEIETELLQKFTAKVLYAPRII